MKKLHVGDTVRIGKNPRHTAQILMADGENFMIRTGSMCSMQTGLMQGDDLLPGFDSWIHQKHLTKIPIKSPITIVIKRALTRKQIADEDRKFNLLVQDIGLEKARKEFFWTSQKRFKALFPDSLITKWAGIAYIQDMICRSGMVRYEVNAQTAKVTVTKKEPGPWTKEDELLLYYGAAWTLTQPPTGKPTAIFWDRDAERKWLDGVPQKA